MILKYIYMRVESLVRGIKYLLMDTENCTEKRTHTPPHINISAISRERARLFKILQIERREEEAGEKRMRAEKRFHYQRRDRFANCDSDCN